MKKGVDFTGVTTAFYCHDGCGRILMHRRSAKCRDENGNWDIGAGSLEFGLSPEENLRKEIKEEYCVDALELTLLGTRSVNRFLADGTPTHWIAFDYLVKVDPAQAAIGEPESIDEIGWFTLDNIPEPMHSQLPKFLEKYQNELGQFVRLKQ